MWKYNQGDSHFLYGDGHGYTLSNGAYGQSLDYGLNHHSHHHGHHHGHHGHHGLGHHQQHGLGYSDHSLYHGGLDHHHQGLGHHSDGHHHGLLSGLLGHHTHGHHQGHHGLGHHNEYAPYAAAGVLPVVVLKVQMRSERSRKVILRKLAKLKGVVSADVDLYNQRVTVTGYVTPEEVLRKVRKTGREAQFWTDETFYAPVGAGYSTAPVLGPL